MYRALLAITVIAAACQRSAPAPTTTASRHALTTPFVARGAIWKYLDDGSNQNTAWRAIVFNDAGWKSGAAPLGYGEGDEATVLAWGPDAANKHVTSYFRRAFTVTDPAQYTALRLSVRRDDGAVVYLNGTEVLRTNIPAGPVGHTTLAGSLVGGADERTYQGVDLDPKLLVAGTNLVAVEVHQIDRTSSDISMDLDLIGSDGAAMVTRGPYLQLGAVTSAIVRWRTSAGTDSRVRYGTAAGALTSMANNTAIVTDHEVTLGGLQAETKYFYSVGSSSLALAGGDADHFFVTPPVPGTARPTRIWVLGDSGTASTAATRVRDAYRTLTGTRHTDVWLMLGDNAYQNGTDAEYQTALFDVFPTVLRQSFLWPAIGNHDTAQTSTPPATLPYFGMFNLPAAAEAGGVASGTEKYYSFDHGNIHFVCLDSMSSSRSATGAMVTWLKADLAANTRDWTIVYFHHPPYSRGSHDSDSEVELREMRQNVLPALEQHGVDLVLAGHSHVYERSFLLDGHYGAASTLTAAMKKNAGSGRPTDGGPYAKATAGPAAHEGAVYVVAGSGGQITGGTPTLNHPAMFVSLNRLGSVVLDVDGKRLEQRFVRETGDIDDFFTIVKGPQANALPTVSITAPASNAVFVAPATLPITATAVDSDGTIASVVFMQGTTALSTDTAAPWEFSWTNVAPGTYQITARATDDKGASSLSGPISVTVNPPAPAAPSNLAGLAASTSQIDLTWTDNATTETAFKLERSTDNVSFTQIALPPANAVAQSVGSLTADTTYHFRVRATNATGDSAFSNTITVRTKAATVCVAELCDGLDNDCDMTADEDFADKGTACTAGLGECLRTGARVCAASGTATTCNVTAGVASSEVCDDKDNDCQGDIDEDFPEKGVVCTVGTGECARVGMRICSPTKTAVVCSASAGTPVAEICDGKDNDCDDRIDEDFADKITPCSVGMGECARTGTMVCAASGAATTCSVAAGAATAELCDGKDNDCDGMSDEDFNDKGGACTSGMGECARMGTRVCAAGGMATTCDAPPGMAGMELCGDGKDNDCDGMTDELCTIDAGPDAAPDVPPDAPADVAADSANDRSTDTASDLTPDVPRDAAAPPPDLARDQSTPSPDAGPVANSPDASLTLPPDASVITDGGTRDGAALEAGAGDGGSPRLTRTGCNCHVGSAPQGETEAPVTIVLGVLAVFVGRRRLAGWARRQS